MISTLKKFYKDKKILLTGHTGFKGGWLSIWLLNLDANITGYALNPTQDPNLYKILGLKNKMRSEIGDVRDKARVQSLFKNFRPEIVIHMAAQSLVRYSYQKPVETYETNVLGAVNILEACRKSSSVRSVVIVTSDKCYENKGENKPYKETAPLGGYDPYSSSKGCAEIVTAAYQRSFFAAEKYGRDHKTGLASARAGNVIGGGDWSKDRLIPDCIKAILHNEPLIIRYPQSVRPWQHVLEPLYGYLLLAKKLYEDGPSFAGPWNFGPGKKNEKPVKWILEKINELWDGKLDWEIEPQQQPHESAYLRLNSKKAQSLLGWKPQSELTSALEKTVDWYKACQNKLNMPEYSLNQIKNYMRGIDA